MKMVAGMRPTRTWILIANGSGAGMLEHNGPGKGLSVLDLSWTAEPVAEFSDRPGRSFKRVGPTRHGLQSHGADQNEAFARTLAAELWELRSQNRFDRLILCAPPALLGHLRKHLPEPLKADVTEEIPKDLTQLPATKMPSHFAAVLPV